MKKRIGITKKLFAITIVVFAVFISSTLIVQTLFFEKYYISKKENDLKANMEKFKAAYNKADSIDSQIQLIEDYQQEFDLKIAIVNNYGQAKFVDTITIRDKADPMKQRILTEFINYSRVRYQGMQNIINMKKGTVIAIADKNEPNEKNIASITPNTENNQVIFALSSLQPVNEAVTVMNGFYKYFYIGAFFLIVLLSLAYSRMIAKPLVKINKTAIRMAELDFTEKCVVETRDEFESVASSLNFLSENLHNALTSLKEANTKLEEDIEKERNLEKMRKEFVAAVSHELKTPISLIDGYAEGLKDEIFEGEEKDYYLDVIIDEARKMGSLVVDMLDLSQLESGNFKLSKAEFDLSELVSHTIRKYSPVINDKKIRFEVSLIEDVTVNADWNRMEQVLTNFITNALRHVDDGGSVFVRMLKAAADEVSVEIENTGSLIVEEEIPKIWDKFYKIDKSRNRKEGGTGIGLSIVKNILELHGYPYGVANTDTGVKFFFKVPC